MVRLRGQLSKTTGLTNMNEFYKTSINRVIDYIQANLSEDLSLKQLSEIACYSQFHFNRIFSSYMGESVYQYIKRVRLEKSAELLLANSQESVTEIALMCGFENSSSFAKSFKSHFRMTATEWRNKLDGFSIRGSTPVQIERGKFFIHQSSPVWTYHFKNSSRQIVIEDIYGDQKSYNNVVENNIIYSLHPEQYAVQLTKDTNHGLFENNYYCNPYSKVVFVRDAKRYSFEHWQEAFPDYDQN